MPFVLLALATLAAAVYVRRGHAAMLAVTVTNLVAGVFGAGAI